MFPDAEVEATQKAARDKESTELARLQAEEAAEAAVRQRRQEEAAAEAAAKAAVTAEREAKQLARLEAEVAALPPPLTVERRYPELAAASASLPPYRVEFPEYPYRGAAEVAAERRAAASRAELEALKRLRRSNGELDWRLVELYARSTIRPRGRPGRWHDGRWVLE